MASGYGGLLAVTSKHVHEQWAREFVLALSRGNDVGKRFGAMPLSGGMGKRSFVLVDRDAIIQIRPIQRWHEPVVEAHRLWRRRGCSVAELLAAGAVAGYRYYVFARVEGEPLSPDHLTPQNLIRYGQAAREMSSVETRLFGEFRCGLNGVFATWREFLLARVHRYAVALSAKNLLPPGTCAIDVIRSARSAFRGLDLNGGCVARPRLLYVDVSLTNALVDTANQIYVVDYDYLISGDPHFVVARFAVAVENESWLRWFASGFGVDDIDPLTLSGYRLVHALEMLTTPADAHTWIAERRPRLLGEVASALTALSVGG